MKKTLLSTGIIFCVFLAFSCNKEKKLMKRLIGNWNIESSERAYVFQDGGEEVYESLNNAGKLVISEDPANNSDEIRKYDLFFIDGNQDTLQNQNLLVTDEKNKRIILQKALNDSTSMSDIVWTIEKEKKNKQVWATYGVDSTFFYPANNMNPGAAGTWCVWRITLKRE